MHDNLADLEKFPTADYIIEDNIDTYKDEFLETNYLFDNFEKLIKINK